jgi:hemerythrin
MSIQFLWDEAYTVGNSKVDEQHKRIFELANSLPEVANEENIKRIIWTMFKHANEHFAIEEKMMKEIGYPKLAEHRELHDELITKLSHISTHSFDNDQSAFQFKKFIYDWIIEHIMNADKEYFRFVHEKRARTFSGSMDNDKQ